MKPEIEEIEESRRLYAAAVLLKMVSFGKKVST